MYTEPDVESSYRQNNIGQTIYSAVILLKPYIVYDFGILNGYSTICIAQALRDLRTLDGPFSRTRKVIACDLFEKYQYKTANKSQVLENLIRYNLENYVELQQLDFYDWCKKSDTGQFDMVHVDISNTAETLRSISFLKKSYPTKYILFEGGSQERDKIDWMIKYNKPPMFPLKEVVNYRILNHNFPSISIL